MKTFLAILMCTGLASSASTDDRVKRFILSFSTCNDALDNCDAYGASVCTQYPQWASDNCKSTCNMCSGGGGSAPQVPQIPQTSGSSTSCSDKLSNCNAYSQSACSDPMYKQWATDNCAKTCNLCSGGGSVPSTGTGSSGSSSGCYYNSQMYQQGQTWNDGCKSKCRCVDGSSGQYECRQLCLNWDLPPTCQMLPPSPGKCCPKPSCPSNIVLQYPQGYVEE